MLNCDELCYYIKLLIYKNSPGVFFMFFINYDYKNDFIFIFLIYLFLHILTTNYSVMICLILQIAIA